MEIIITRTKLEDESIDFTDDDKLLDYLRENIWSETEGTEEIAEYE